MFFRFLEDWTEEEELEDEELSSLSLSEDFYLLFTIGDYFCGLLLFVLSTF